MSYARSPRPVCSMTMGTSIICSFAFYLSHSCPNQQVRWGSEAANLRGLMVQKIEGLIAADSIPDSIQRPIPCQSSPDGLRRLFRLQGQSLDLPVDLLIADLDFFLLRDPVQQQ